MATVQIHKEKLVVPSQLVQVRKQEGKRIIKVFVADSHLNINGEGIPKDAIDNIMPTMKGKSYVLPPFLDHPQRPKPYPSNPQDDINLIHQTAKPYEGGIIYDYERVSSEDNPGYNAFVELTSDTAIALFDMGMLPRWHSMSIYKLNPNEPNNEIRSAVVNNICAVANPAYGAKARILGMCVGDRDDCTTGLRESSAKEEGQTDKVREEAKTKGCQTMKTIGGLDPEDTFRFEPSLLGKEVTFSDMSAQAEAGTTISESVTEYPASGRKVVTKNGQVVSDTKNDQNKPKETKAESEGETVKKEETKEEKTVTKEEKTEGQKDAKINTNISKEEDKNDDNNGNEKPNQSEEKDAKQTGSLEERMRNLESEHKNTSKLLEKTANDNKYLRRKIIEDKVNSAHWLKPEQKEQRIDKYAKMDISTEDLVFALDDAFGAQIATIKAQPNREKQSSVSTSTQYHEDDDNEVAASEKAKPQKLTLDLLRPRT